MEAQALQLESSPCSLQLVKSLCHNKDPSTAKYKNQTYIYIFIYKHKHMRTRARTHTHTHTHTHIYIYIYIFFFFLQKVSASLVKFTVGSRCHHVRF